jgi:hypothetical protein
MFLHVFFPFIQTASTEKVTDYTDSTHQSSTDITTPSYTATECAQGSDHGRLVSAQFFQANHSQYLTAMHPLFKKLYSPFPHVLRPHSFLHLSFLVLARIFQWSDAICLKKNLPPGRVTGRQIFFKTS